MDIMLTVTNLNGDSAMIDLEQNQSVALSWSFMDIAEMQIKGGYSKQFRVLATDRNVNLFGPMFDVNFTTGAFSYHQKCEATLAVDTVPIANGHIQMLRTYSRENVVHEFELVFYSETPDLSRAVGAKKLSDIDYTDLNHEISYDNVVNGDVSDRWKYALTDRGQKWSQLGEAGSRPVLNTDQPIFPNEMTLFVRSSWIFNKIMSDAGFQWTGSALEGRLDDYYIPYVNSKTNQTGVPPQAYLFNLGYNADQTGVSGGIIDPSLTEFYDNGSDVSASVWTAPFTGVFYFKMWATVDASASGQTMTLQLRKVGSTIPVWASPQLNLPTTEVNYQSPIFSVFLGQGQQFFMRMLLSSGGTYTIGGNATNDPATGTGWALVNTDLPAAGETISVGANAPDISQIDFVKSIILAHNCLVIPDRNIPKKLEIVNFTEYMDAGADKDWTAKLDLSKDVTISPTTDFQKRVLHYTYKAGSDVASELYTKLGRTFGDARFDGYTISPTDTPNEFAKGDLKAELTFASTPLVELNGTNIPICKFVSANGDFQTPGARLLYVTGTYDVALYDEGTLSGVMTTVNLASHYSDIIPEVSDYDLCFLQEVPLYQINGNPYNNLFNLFHRPYLNEVYSPQARIMDAYFQLELTDILNFKFNDRIFVKDAYWRIIDISDYIVGTNESTKVRLMKVLNRTVDCVVTPSGTTVGGQVTWIDANGDPASGTQACCERYGYNWNAVGSYCSSLEGAGHDRRTSPNAANNQFANSLDSLVLADYSVIAPDATRSLIMGGGHNIGEGNEQSIFVGDKIKAAANLKASMAIGKNAKVITSGLHVGAGFNATDRSGAEGRAQFGFIGYSGNGTWATNGSSIGISIEGTGTHLEMDDESMWAAEISVSIVKLTAGNISARGHAFFIVDLAKYGGIARNGTPTTIHESGSIGNFGLAIDVSTNTAQHRLAITSTGGGAYPQANIYLTATVKYTQVKTT